MFLSLTPYIYYEAYINFTIFACCIFDKMLNSDYTNIENIHEGK